ncbi:MAG: serine/threonine protein kinase [Deltaproteobacteria bacterium]|nr:serine/threonine protein kinase [Deltaproteobacteria bacterium]
MSAADASAGRIPDRVGKHLIVGKLASGGMATTYLARLVGPAGFENVVVLKRMLPHLAEDQRFRVMFEDEARTVARIRHPNVVRIFELVSDVGELYLVMEYLEGDTLRQLMKSLAQRGTRLPWAMAAYIVSEAALGLHAAHEQTDDDGRTLGLVHRDVSPHNLFLTCDGGVKVIDFGIAKSADHVSHTSTGELKGKFAYMSPEQVEQRPVDRRTDVFALGVVLWELVARKRLFARDTQMATMRAVANDVAPPLSSLDPEVPAALEALVARALQKDENARIADMLELRRGLLEVLRDAGIVDPKDELAKLANEAFVREAAERTELIRRSRGTTSGLVSIPDVADAEGTPSKVRTMTAGSAPARETAGAAETSSPSRRFLIAWSLIALLVMVAVGIGWMAAGSTLPVAEVAPPTSPPTTPTPAVIEPTPTPPIEAPVAPARVHVTFESDPPGALVTIDEIARGTTPLVLELPRGEAPLHAELELSGRRAVSLSFLPDRDQTLRTPLPRSGRASSGETMTEGSMGTSMEGGGFYAFE